MSSIPQCRIEQAGSATEPFFVIRQDVDGSLKVISRRWTTFWLRGGRFSVTGQQTL